MATLSGLLGSQFSGSTGPAGTIAIGTVTSGGSASVTNSGTSTAAVLNFNLPVGTFTWPSAGIPVSNGSAWSTSLTAPPAGVEIGYRNIPHSGGADKTTSYTLAAADVGKFVSLGTGGAITVPASTFAAGDIISLYNNTTGNTTITCSAVTTYIGGTNTTKTSVTLATRGICSVFFYSPTVCIITGNIS